MTKLVLLLSLWSSVAVAGFAADAQIVFPDTFKNPGASAPIADLTVHNTGGAVLRVISLAIEGDDVFTLVDATPVAIAGGASQVFQVKFTPRTIGDPPRSRLVLTTDDATTPVAVIELLGSCVGRDIAFGPKTIEVGVVAVGAVLVVAEAFELANLDEVHTFAIAGLTSDDPQFLVPDVSGVGLAPSGRETFSVIFQPLAEGTIETPARLYLDEDPEAQASVTLRGTAVTVDVHGGGGCRVGGSGSLGLGLALLALRRRRA